MSCEVAGITSEVGGRMSCISHEGANIAILLSNLRFDQVANIIFIYVDRDAV